MPLAGVGSARAVRACSWQVARVGKRGWFVGECALMLVEESLASRLQLGEDVVRRDGQPCPSRRSASLKSIMLKSRVVRYASGAATVDLYGKLKTLPK